MQDGVTTLGGLRVVDRSSSVAGVVATMLFADLGADVIRFDRRIGAGREELAGEVMWQRNKRVVTADPEAVLEAMATADVIVTTEDVAAAQADAARDRHGTIIHLDMSAVATEAEAPVRVYEAMLNAWYGIAARQSSFDGGPIDIVVPFASYAQALGAVTAALAALLERERSGSGQRVTVDARHGVLTAATTTSLIDPDAPAPRTAVGPSGPTPNYAPYLCADGEWIFLAALSPKFQYAAFAVLGIPDIMNDPRIAGDGSRFFHPDNQQWARQMIADAFLAHGRADWLERLQAADVPCAALGDPTTWLDHPQMRAIGQRVEIDDPRVGPAVTAAFPVALDATPAVVFRPRQFATDHTWRREPWSIRPADPAGSTRVDGPLSGVRMLDLGTVVAGPFGGRLLAGLGADVVKIEPPAGDAFRPMGALYVRGHRSVAIDLTSSDGREAFLRLVEHADVVLDNFRPGVLRKLGIDDGALRGVNPAVITASIDGFGGVGPIGRDPGFDPVLQAMSGMMTVQGGDAEPVFHTVAANDLSAGMAVAMGVCAALLVRSRLGYGQHLSTSLAAVSAYMLSGEVVQYRGRPEVQRGGRDFRGPSALSRFYATADGWVRIHLDGRDQAVRAALLEEETSEDEVEAGLRTAAAGLTSLQLVDAVRRVGGWASPCRTNPELAADPAEIAGRYLEEVTRIDGKSFLFPGHYARFSRTERTAELVMSGVGQDTRELLLDAGLDAEQVQHLCDRGVVVANGTSPTFAVAAYR